ncbi:hypothetical protein BCR32DRAFT_267865 [Anaeromyces robustus]|uniref:CHHC U11-48K-type domain-containing protein n=1 Tax=Anaeromyces robustus TaxID=1754192 RepID=A0A1Y1X8L0_9FUNG|nr:hypothetical protein BCR32DRAFT_267865 [Anaeromyces robustus]|eukprot:ORX82101.1 hypothetical protein BCR32DRAFT_267865 [Anaeromyces robustus]
MPVETINLNNDTIELREKRISELDNQIRNLELNFNEVLKKYQLDIDTLLKKKEQIEDRVKCPFNKNHFVTKKNYEKHFKRCELISKGINTKLSLPKPPSSQFFYTNTNVISLLRKDRTNDHINKNVELHKYYEKANDLPSYEIEKYENDKHFICNVKDGLKSSYEIDDNTVQGRLNECITDFSLSSKIEDKYIEKTKKLQNFDKIMELVEKRKEEIENNEKTTTNAYIEQRDYKRRRKSYRAKNIRITKRSPTQIQKDIINSFNKDYKLYLEIEKELYNKGKKRKHKH